MVLLCTLRAAPLATCTATAVAGLVVWWWKRTRLPTRFELRRVIRPCVLAAAPYGFPSRYDHVDPVMLDMNESSLCPLDDEPWIEPLQLHRYPDPRQTQLKQAFASLRSADGAAISPEQVVFGCGSDELIELLIRVTCAPGRDSIMICSPTYAMYAVFARHNDVGVIDVPLTSDDFQLDVEAIRHALTPRVRLVFLCSPGNPTGRCLERAAMLHVAALATGALVVADEAYVDFAPPAVSCAAALASTPNLLVSQTLSKAWGLAGARVGVLLASAELVSVLERVKAPFNLSSLSERAALDALARRQRVATRVADLLTERARVVGALKQMPAVQRVFRSEANFVLVRVDRCKEVCEMVAARANLVLRFRGAMLHCKDCVRITVGLRAENDAMLCALREAIRVVHGGSVE